MQNVASKDGTSIAFEKIEEVYARASRLKNLRLRGHSRNRVIIRAVPNIIAIVTFHMQIPVSSGGWHRRDAAA